MRHIVRATLLAVIGLVATLVVSLSSPIPAVAPDPTREATHAFTYDKIVRAGLPVADTTERGPPAIEHDDTALSPADVHGSRSLTARSQRAAILTDTTYDHAARSAHSDSRRSTSSTPSDALRGELRSVSAVSIAAKSGTEIRKVGDVLETVDDVMANPQLLKGRHPALDENILKDSPGWQVETLGRGSAQGRGWVFRQYTDAGNPTGLQLRWHPGGGHHGPDPYWRVIGPNGDLGGIIR